MKQLATVIAAPAVEPAAVPTRVEQVGRISPTLVRLIGFVAAYVVGAHVIALSWTGRVLPLRQWVTPWLHMLPLLLAPIMVAIIIHARLTVRDASGLRINGWRGWKSGVSLLRAGAFSNERLVALAIVIVVVPIFHRAFSIYKSMIPIVHPFRFDVHLAEADRVLHFGRYPHEWLTRLASPEALGVLSSSYVYWHVIVLATLLCVVLVGDEEWRDRVLVAFIATWIVVGNGFATLLSSAGPCFYDGVTGLTSPYAGLMATLRGTTGAEVALGQQASLWLAYTSSLVGLGAGISAMPSMHVAIPALFAVATWRRRRWLAAGFGAFTLLILLASVVLGWHYAVDGYASMAAVPFLWICARKLASGPRRVGFGKPPYGNAPVSCAPDLSRIGRADSRSPRT